MIRLDAAVTFPKRSELQGRTPLPAEIPIATAPGTGSSHPEISEHPPDNLSGQTRSGPGPGSSRPSGGSSKPNNSDDDPPPAEDKNHGHGSENDKDPEKPENEQKPEKPENGQKSENSDGQDDPHSSQHGGNASYTPLPPTPSTLSTNTRTTVRSTVLTSTEVLPTPTQVSLTPTEVSSTPTQTPISVASGLRIDTLPVSFIVIFPVLVLCWTSLFFI